MFYQLTNFNIKNFVRNEYITEALSRDGHPTGVFLDIRDWSDGVYQLVLDNIVDLENWVMHQIQFAKMDDLQKFGRTIDGIIDLYGEAVGTSHTNAINSQLKYEVANKVLVALVSQGYIPEEGDFHNNGDQERYCARAVSPDGSEITIFIDSEAHGTIGNHLSILSSDYQKRTNYELAIRAKEIRDAVSDYGLEISNMVEQPLETSPINQSKYLVRYKK